MAIMTPGGKAAIVAGLQQRYSKLFALHSYYAQNDHQMDPCVLMQTPKAGGRFDPDVPRFLGKCRDGIVRFTPDNNSALVVTDLQSQLADLAKWQLDGHDYALVKPSVWTQHALVYTCGLIAEIQGGF